MTVSSTAYLKGFYDQTRALGDKLISSDVAMQIDGFESSWLLCKQCPHPLISPSQEIEIPTPLGAASWQPAQLKVHQQGPIAWFETTTGAQNALMMNLIRTGGMFSAKIFEGVPTRFIKAYRIRDAFCVLESPDRDWENRSQAVMITGTLFFHYFGEIIPGNTPVLAGP